MRDPISPEALARYRRTARQRHQDRLVALEARRQQALRCAAAAARELRGSFGASRVFVFGSVTDAPAFHERSDIDLAVAGIAVADYWRAGAAAERAAYPFEVDIVDLDSAPTGLLESVLSSGTEL
jgi:predicted nucleotidyltransferase